MAYQIKHLSDSTLITVSEPPVWVSGIWECGNMRFTDPGQTAYAPVTVYPTLTPMQFYLAFTAAEMIDIKGSADPLVKEFYARYQLAVQTNTPIDPNLVSVQEGLAYLATATTATPAGAGILAAGRVAQILAGTPQ